MEIRITECTGTFHQWSILKDLGTYKKIEQWLEAIINNETAFKPLECAVKYNDNWEHLILCGDLIPEAKKTINKIKKLPSLARQLPNDTILIKADHFERELYFNLDGK